MTRNQHTGPCLGQGSEDEPPLGNPGMGHREPVAVDHRIAVQQQIQIQSARPPSLAAFPPGFPLDIQAPLQQGTRPENGVEHDHGIEKVGLLGTNRGSLPERRTGDDVALPGQRVDRAGEVAEAITYVRPEADGDPRVRSRLLRGRSPALPDPVGA